jgi:hypothetical protein
MSRIARWPRTPCAARRAVRQGQLRQPSHDFGVPAAAAGAAVEMIQPASPAWSLSCGPHRCRVSEKHADVLGDAGAADRALDELLGTAPAEAGVAAWLKEDLRVALEAYFASNWRVVSTCVAWVLLKRLVGESYTREGVRGNWRGGDVDDARTVALTFEEYSPACVSKTKR